MVARQISTAYLALSVVAFAGCSEFDGLKERTDGDVASSRAALTVPVTSSEYKLAEGVDPDVIGDRVTELWARVYRPATLVAGRRYPLLVFLHGNHQTCGRGSNPRVDDNSQYTTTGSCPQPDYVVVPSHEGYGYIAEELAAQEYIVVSINANRGINVGAGISGDSGLNLTRGRLVLKHLTMLSQWDRVSATTPASLGTDLFGHIDFSQVGLMGHSRGGEGMRAAYNQYLDPDSPWPARIVTPVEFRGIFEIGPVDGQTSRVLDMQNLRWSVILPMCDGDVSSLAGIRPFDRSFAFLEETPPSLKASLTVWGANHNYYNSEWQQAEALASCSDHEPIFTSGPGITGSAPQRETGRILMSAFFLGNVGQQQDSSRNAVFDPLNALPTELTHITRVDRGYTPSPDADVTLRLEDFLSPAGTSSSGQPNIHSNVTVTHGFLPEHAAALRGGTLSWTNASSNTFFQVNFTPAQAPGVSLSPYFTLDLRVERARDLQLNLSDTTDFTLQLVDANDGLSAPVRIAEYLDLRGPVGWANGTHRMLQTARIPLANFAPITLESIRALRLTFDQTASGTIHVANIRATVADAESPSAVPFPSNFVPQAGAGGPASGMGSILTVAAGRIATLARVTRSDLANAIDLEVVGDTPFPGLQELPVLRSGKVEVTTLSRFPDPADMRRLTFTLSAAQFAALKDRQALSVHYGEREVWKLGALDKRRLSP
jgi:hypothetical protein